MCVEPACSESPTEQLSTYLRELKDFRMYLRVCLVRDPSCVSTKSTFLHPAGARAVNAPHTSSRCLFSLVFFNFLNSSLLPPDKCFAAEGLSSLNTSCFEEFPYVFNIFLSSMFLPHTSALLSDSFSCLEIHPR